jgi:hypothetical protein
MRVFCESFCVVGHKIDIPEDKFETEEEAYDYWEKLNEKLENEGLSYMISVFIHNRDKLWTSFVLSEQKNGVSSSFELKDNNVGKKAFESMTLTDYSTDNFDMLETLLGHSIDRKKEIFSMCSIS